MTSTEETQLISETNNEIDLNNCKIIKPVAVDSKKEAQSESNISNNELIQNDEFVMSNYCLRLNHECASINKGDNSVNNENDKSLNGSFNADKSLYELGNDSSLESKLVYPLKIGLNKIGRAELNHIVILNKNISKNHGCIEIKVNDKGDLESCYLWDIGSLNKTRLNNQILKPNDKIRVDLDDVIEFNLVNFTFSKMNESEFKEQEKGRSYMIKLNELDEKREKNGLFEIQNTLQDDTTPVTNSLNGNDSNYKLFMADTDVDESNIDDDLNEKSSRCFNNTSAGTDFHLEMSASVLQPNHSTISQSDKSITESIPNTMVEEDVKQPVVQVSNDQVKEKPSEELKENGNHEKEESETGDTLIINEESNSKPDEKYEASLPVEVLNSETNQTNSDQVIEISSETNIDKNLNDSKNDINNEKLQESKLENDEENKEKVNNEETNESTDDFKTNQPVKEEVLNDAEKNDNQLAGESKDVLESSIEQSSTEKLDDKNQLDKNLSNEETLPKQLDSQEENKVESSEVNDKISNVPEIEKSENVEENNKVPLKRGRRSVKPQERIENNNAEEEISNSKPRRSVRVLASVPPPLPKSNNESKRKSVVSQDLKAVEVVKSSEESLIELDKQVTESDTGSKTNNQVDEKNETVSESKEQEKEIEEKSTEKVIEPEKENKTENDTEIKTVQPEKNTTSTGIVRRSSLRIRANVSNSTQLNPIKDKLINKRNVAKKLEENDKNEIEDSSAPTATKRTRKSIVSEITPKNEEVSKGENKSMKSSEDVVEKKPPLRQARVNRRSTIAVIPAQIQEAKQKISAAIKSRKPAGPVVAQPVKEESEEETSDDKTKRPRRNASSDKKKEPRKSTSTKPAQNNVDTYHYDENDNFDSNNSFKKRKRKSNNKQDESITISKTADIDREETKISNSKLKAEDIDNKLKLKNSSKKRNNKNLNSSLNAARQSQDEDDDNDVLSKTLPFTAKLFFHSKRRKTLPPNTAISSSSKSETTDNVNHKLKRYSYSSLLNNNKINESNVPAVDIKNNNVASPKALNLDTKKKFKLNKTQSSSSEGSSDSESDNEPLSVKKAKQNHSVSFKSPVEEEMSAKQTTTLKRKNTISKRQTASEVVESIASDSSKSRNSRNKKTASSLPKIMATGIILTEKQKQIISNLGGEIVNDPKDASHLITNKIRKSCKFLSCLNRGVFIVNERWLEESNKVKTFSNPTGYALTDTQCEKQYKFSLQTSLMKAKTQSLFQDWKFILIHQDSPQEELSRSDIKTIIECGNGELIDELPNNETDWANCCILYSNLAKFKKDTLYNEKDLLKMTLDTFLNSILKQSFDIFHKIDQQNE